MIRRAAAMMRDPAAAWAEVATERRPAARIALDYVAPMSLLPAFAWMIALSVFPGDLGGAFLHPDAASIVRAGFGTWLGSVMSVVLMAASLAATGRMYGAAGGFDGAFRVAAYGATPVWLAGALLVKPVLILAALVAVLHACYLYSGGLQRVLGVREGEAPECVAVSALLTVAMSMLLGGMLGALGIL